MIAKALSAMVDYFSGDMDMLDHTLQVYGYARLIGMLENLDPQRQEILECAAALHDVGARESRRAYGSVDGIYREQMSTLVAGELLQALHFPQEMSEEILLLIRRHRSYTLHLGLAHRILVESVLLASASEGLATKYSDIQQVRDTLFQTKSGIELFNTVYGIAPRMPRGA